MTETLLAAIGIGANLDGPARQVRNALAALNAMPHSRLIAASSLYGNPPMGPTDQPDYINAVALVETRLRANSLLTELQTVEFRQGRRRGGLRWGARTVDLDLLCFGTHVINTARLTVPHPGIGERAFVVLPLREIAPALEIPGLGPVAQLAARFDASTLVPVDGR